MKRFLIILIIAAMALTPCFAEKTFTEEEFYEVYDALYETTELLKAREADIISLTEEIKSLQVSNKDLIKELNGAKQLLLENEKLLSEAKKELAHSSAIINKLNNQRFLVGGNIVLGNLPNAPVFGFGLNVGHKLELGFLIAELNVLTDKTFNFSLGYSIIF